MICLFVVTTARLKVRTAQGAIAIGTAVMTWSAVAGGIGFVFVVGLRVHADARRSLRARTTVAVATFVLGCVGALAGAARGALAGIATAETGGVAVYGRAFATVERAAEPPPT